MLKAKKYILLLAMFFILSALYAQTSSDTINIEELKQMSIEELLNVRVDVSSFHSLNLFNTPSTVNIIDRETINRYNFQSIAEALNTLAGVDVYQTVIDRNVPTIRGILQYFYANKILLMINGIPTWQPIYGNGYIDRISIFDVERIEVLKGPASVLHGSNAYVGAINIILKNPQQTKISGYLNSGFPFYGSSGINVNIKHNDFILHITANTGIEKNPPYKFQNQIGYFYLGDSLFLFYDESFYNNINFNLGYKNHELYINNFYLGHTFPGIYPSYGTGANGMVNNKGSLLCYRFRKQLHEKLSFRASLVYDYFQRDFPENASRDTFLWMAGDRIDMSTQIQYDFGSRFGLETGIDFEIRNSHGHNRRSNISGDIIAENMVHDDNVYEGSYYLQLQLNLQKFRLLAGSRLTANNLFGQNLSSRISALYQIGNQSSFKFIYGESFRVPTMFELYFDHPTVLGNRRLEPETSRSYELAYLLGTKRFFFQILAYLAHYNNLIQRQAIEDSFRPQYQNALHFNGYGSDVEIKYRNTNLADFFVNYNFLQGMGEEASSNYRYMPEHSISAGINRSFNQFNLAFNGRYYSQTMGYLDQINAQFTFNAHLSYNYTSQTARWQHMISIQNLNNSKMLIPQYIRKTENINELQSISSGRRIMYSLRIYL